MTTTIQAHQPPEIIFCDPPAGLTEAQLSALERAEERRAAEAEEAARKAANAAVEPREAAARAIEGLGFEGAAEVAAALRGGVGVTAACSGNAAGRTSGPSDSVVPEKGRRTDPGRYPGRLGRAQRGPERAPRGAQGPADQGPRGLRGIP